MFDALKAITQYQKPKKLKERSWDDYGVGPEDAVEMAYENVLDEARLGIKGMRRPKE